MEYKVVSSRILHSCMKGQWYKYLGILEADEIKHRDKTNYK